MELNKQKKGYIMVLICGILWGSGLLVTQYLLDNGIKSKDLVSLKMIFGCITMILWTYFKDKDLLKMDRKGLMYAAGMGLIAHAIFNLFMFIAMERTTVATTVALMYTSPIFVMIISRFLFKEKLAPNKMVALILCVLGIFLTVTGGDIGELSFNVSGILFGLSAGLCYAIMNLFSKFLEDKYSQLTMLTYTLGFAFLFSLSFSNPLVVFKIEFNILVWLCLFILGAVVTALTYLLFITGLSYGVESSKAAIIVAIEVPVSVIGSYLVFRQDVGGWKTIGIVLVLASIIILQGNTFQIQARGKEDIELQEE